MTVILPFFDLFGYDVLLRNHMETLKHYDSLGYDIITIEAVLPGKQPLVDYTSSRHRHITVTAPDRLLLQFNLFNIAAGHTDDPYLLLCDSGAIVSEAALRAASDMLCDGTDVLQPFEYVDYLHADGVIDRTAMGAYADSIHTGRGSTHNPGMAICARHEYFDAVGGFFDRVGFSGGDALLYSAVFNYNMPARISYRATEAYRADAPPARAGFVPGSVKHLWHRPVVPRYQPTVAAIKEAGFQPEMLTYTDEGVLTWVDSYRDIFGDYIARVLGKRSNN